MNSFLNELKYFEDKNQKRFYLLKDIVIKEHRGEEMASANITIYDENRNEIDVFAVYDERYKVLYAMPQDVKRWFEEHQMRK